MQHKLFNSKFKPSVGRTPLLDIIGDSPLGENPHRAVAMGLIFERSVHDCRERRSLYDSGERMVIQAGKSSQSTFSTQPNDRRTFTRATTTTQPTGTQPSPPATRYTPVAAQPAQEQALKTEPFSLLRAMMQPPQPPPTNTIPLKASANPPTFQMPTFGVTTRRSFPKPS